ncbi:MAG: hypothetical protein ABSF98_02355 [Bryobacteraceae bacterium]|jgi:hypothetical protein
MRRPQGAFALLLATILVSGTVLGQLTTGVVEGIVRAQDGHPLGGFLLVIAGGVHFRAEVRTSSDGQFSAVLPYGDYLVSAAQGSVPIFVPALETTRLDLVLDAAGAPNRDDPRTPPAAGLFTDTAEDRIWPEANSLQGMLLSREPATTAEPVDFTGVSDNRLAIVSQRGSSWTSTQFKLLGMDATDSYQPGMPVILADVEALDQVVVRSAFAATASSGYGTEVGVFLGQPGASWHVRASTADTGTFLSSSNLPPPSQRGIVQQADYFRWFTRDGIDGGGPLAKWVDVFVRGAAQWSLQTVPEQPPGTDQRGRLLFGDVRGRVRAGPRDQIDALYSGSRINLSNWGVPAGLDTLEGRRMSPPFVLPGGFPTQSGLDHLDFLQVGWTHQMPRPSGLGALQVRYGYSAAHLNTDPPAEIFGVSEPFIDLSNGMVSEAPPISNLAIRTRQSIEGTWQPGEVSLAASRHQMVAGGGWNSSRPVNRFTIPSDINLLTVAGAPADVIEFNAPLDSASEIRASTGFAADHVRLGEGLSLDLGVLADFSRGSLPGQSSGVGQFAPLRTYPAQPDVIVWNSLSPRAGFAWRVPGSSRLVVRGAYSRLYSPLAGRYLDYASPNSLSGSEYQWIDRNGDGRFQLGEEGPLLMRFGGLYSSIAPSLRRPYADEFHAGADYELARRTFVRLHLFRRDDKQRLAAMDIGVPASAYTPVTILDPGPDGIPGTADGRALTVYEQNPATLGQDRYLLTNPPGLQARTTGWEAEFVTQWRATTLQASYVAEKSEGPTNPGDAAIENDPGILGALLLDPNTSINAAGRSFTDREQVAKVQTAYHLPRRWGGMELSSVADYVGGLPFARQLLVTGLAQGPFLVPVTPRGAGGGYRAQPAINWNLRLMREFRLPVGTLAAFADILNVANFGQKIQENDFTGPAFNLRLPVAIQEPRSVRLQLRYEF